MHGAYEYGQAMMDSGVSADLMRRVFKERASKGMTNSYASIRDMREGHLMDGLTDEERSLSRMAEMITASTPRTTPPSASKPSTANSWRRRSAA